jgi:hypothetical protein
MIDFSSSMKSPSEVYPGDLAVVRDDVLHLKTAPDDSTEHAMYQDAIKRILEEADRLTDLGLGQRVVSLDERIVREDEILTSIYEGYDFGKAIVQRTVG